MIALTREPSASARRPSASCRRRGGRRCSTMRSMTRSRWPSSRNVRRRPLEVPRRSTYTVLCVFTRMSLMVGSRSSGSSGPRPKTSSSTSSNSASRSAMLRGVDSSASNPREQRRGSRFPPASDPHVPGLRDSAVRVISCGHSLSSSAYPAAAIAVVVVMARLRLGVQTTHLYLTSPKACQFLRAVRGRCPRWAPRRRRSREHRVKLLELRRRYPRLPLSVSGTPEFNAVDTTL